MRENRKSLLSRYIVLGGLAVMIPLCMMILFWARQNCQEYERQRMDAENLLLFQMKEKTENEMSSLKKISEQLMFDKEITPWHLKKGGSYTIEAMEKLEYYCRGTELFEDLLICLNGDTQIYRTDGYESFSTLSGTSFRLAGSLTSTNLYELLDSNAYFNFLDLSEQLNLGINRKNMITYPLISHNGESYGTLVGLMPMDYFQKNLPVSELASDTLILSGGGEILYSTIPKIQKDPELMRMLEGYQSGKNFYKIELWGKSYRAVVHRSDMTQWYYVRLVKVEELTFWQRREVLPFAGLLMLISLVFAGMIGVLLAFYNYLPVRNLLYLFNPNISYSAKRDELSLINLYIRNLQTESSYMKQQLVDKELLQIRWFFTAILYGGTIAGEVDQKLLEKYGFREHVCEFCIVLLLLQGGATEEDFENRLKQLETKELLYITREPGGGFICLYSSCGEKGIAGEKVEDVCHRLKGNGYHLRASRGQCTEVFSGLRDSLNESLLAAELDSDSAVAFLESTFKSNIPEFWKPSREELLLELVMRSGDKEEIMSKSRKLEEELFRKLRYYRSNEMQYVLHRMMNYLVEYSKGMSQKEIAGDLFAAMAGCKELKTFFTIFRKSVELFSEGSSISGARVVKGRQMQEIRDFVDENFQRPQMSLSYIANHFGLRDSYLSKVFKENIGESYMDYLLRKRMEEAARLLSETDMTVKQVVKSVGYEDVVSFTKKFSAKYGMTPAIYRKQMHTKDKKG